jgi:uncharacterized membrane protein YfcA
VLPAAILFSTIAIGTGVSGALFFSPFFMIVVGLSPAQAVGAGLLTEVFGMGNGLRSYVGQGVVDYATARWLLLGAVPTVAVGALVAHMVPEGTLKVVFGAGLVVLAAFLLFMPSPAKCVPGAREGELIRKHSKGKGITVVRARDGTTYEYPTCWRVPGVSLAALGGTLTGLISAGLPEISTTQLILRCRLPVRVAVATSVFTLAITAVVGASIHALAVQPAWQVVAWSIPGVLVGSMLGSWAGKYVPSSVMEKVLGVVFALVGFLILALEVLA